MDRLKLALALAFAPCLSTAYHYAAKALMSSTEAAKYFEHGGSIEMQKLTVYGAVVTGASVLGIASAVLLAIEVANLVKRVPS